MESNNNPVIAENDDRFTTSLLKLLSKSKITTRSRFAGYRRLSRQNQVSIMIMSIFSFFSASGSLLALVFYDSIKTNNGKIIATALVLTSMVSIVFQLYETTRSYERRAYILYKCAIALSELNNEIQHSILLGISNSNDDQMWSAYNTIIREHEENHHDVDYRYATRDERKIVDKILSILYYYIHTYISFILYIFVLICIYATCYIISK